MRRKILDTSCGPIDLSGAGQPQLPYNITKGVTATREGLNFDTEELAMFIGHYYAGKDSLIASWPDAAERLRYREGEPWCTETLAGSIICPRRRADTDVERALHRLAAILCDDAEAFRVLHWRIHNLCNTRAGTNPVETDGVTPDRGQE